MNVNRDIHVLFGNDIVVFALQLNLSLYKL